MITKDKVTEIFYVLDEFSKNFDARMQDNSLPCAQAKSRRNRKASLSDSEIMTILLCFHFNSFRNFKHYYLSYIRQTLKAEFPDAVSYNRFDEKQANATLGQNNA